MKTLINIGIKDSPTEAGIVATSAERKAEERTQKQILDLIVHKDDVSWKQIIFELIDTEQMDPWDINISLISQKFLGMLKKLKEMDFRISGKVVLASAILLKMKTEKLQDEDLAMLDHLIQSAEEPIDLGLDDAFGLFDDFGADGAVVERPKLVPRTPQPRKRKVSVYDLVEALEQALDTESRRPPKRKARTIQKVEMPDEGFRDITEIIQEVYDHVYDHYETKKKKSGSLMFKHITRSEDPRDKVLTFIPLLHLENAQKVAMEQDEHFGPITVHLTDTTPPDFSSFAEE
ncbi:hypothetical protein GOV11_04410 [Candidatus Woesearchaeota archaeon]|nr:hypothetical protein [Candidatus Woesearchaeota archaeon]